MEINSWPRNSWKCIGIYTRIRTGEDMALTTNPTPVDLTECLDMILLCFLQDYHRYLP